MDYAYFVKIKYEIASYLAMTEKHKLASETNYK